MATICKPPAPIVIPPGRPSIFLAGSIEMGTAEHWQARMEQALSDVDVLLFNPRRDDWDASWVQSIDHPQFRQQVEWELHALERVDLIPMYFSPDTKSPITLLELGLWARSGRLLVCCPEGFWRKGNVDIVCSRYNVSTFACLEALIAATRLWCLQRSPTCSKRSPLKLKFLTTQEKKGYRLRVPQVPLLRALGPGGRN